MDELLRRRLSNNAHLVREWADQLLRAAEDGDYRGMAIDLESMSAAMSQMDDFLHEFGPALLKEASKQLKGGAS